MSIKYLIEQFRSKYQDNQISYFDFEDILSQFSQLDARCNLEANIMREIYNVLSEKQNGFVTYNSIEILIFEFLIQQPIPNLDSEPLLQIDKNDIGPVAKLLRLALIETLTPEILSNLQNFHKYFIMKLNLQQDDLIDFEDLKKIGNELQNQFYINSESILNYFSDLRDTNNMISNKDIHQLLIELECAIHQAQKNRLSLRSSIKNNLNQINNNEEIYNLSSEEDDKNKSKISIIQQQLNDYDESKNLQIEHFGNLLLQRLDLLKQSKYFAKIQNGTKIASQMVQIIYKLDAEVQQIFEKSNSKIEELILERNLIQNKLIQEEQEKKIKIDQISQLLIANDSLIDEINHYESDLLNLNQQIAELSSDSRSFSALESELKAKLIEIEILDQQKHNYQTEISRLNNNNKILLETIVTLENQQNQNQQISAEQEVASQDIENQFEIQEIQKTQLELQERIRFLEVEKMDQEKLYENLEQQLLEARREVNYYRVQSQSQYNEMVDLRKSLTIRFQKITILFYSELQRPSSMFQQFGGNLNQYNRVTNFGNNKLSFSQNRNSQYPYGRISQFPNNRISNQSQNGMSIFGRGSLRGQQNRISQLGSREKVQPELGTNNTNLEKFEELGSPLLIKKVESNQYIAINNVVTIQEELNENQDDQRISIPEKIQQNSTIDQMKKSQMVVNFTDFWNDRQPQNDLQQNTELLPQEYKPDYSFIQFDETILYIYDYMGLRDDAKILEIIGKEKVKYQKPLIKCFSDSVIRVNGKGQRARRVLFASEFNVYIFETEKCTKITRSFPIEKITKIIFSESSPILCCLLIKDLDDYLFESFKRSEFNQFLTESLSQRKLNLYELEYKNSFTIQFKGSNKRKRIEEIANGVYLSGSKQAAFKISQKQGFEQIIIIKNQGYLSIFEKKWVTKEWKELFVILCEVGLILFENPGDQIPKLFIPLVDSLIIKNPKQAEINSSNMFKIGYQTQDQEYLFKAASSALLDEWYMAIHTTIINQFLNQKKIIGQQKNDIEARRQSAIQ